MKRHIAPMLIAALSSSAFLQPAFAAVRSPLLRAGAVGQTVVELQQDLAGLGYAVGQPDGTYGARTTAAVSSFQRNNHLTVSGVVDAQTWALLVEYHGLTNFRQVPIYFNNHRVAVPYAFTAHGTTYMPIWYVIQMLKSLQIVSTWAQNDWDLSVPPLASVDLTHIQLNVGPQAISINHTVVEKVTSIAYPDPYSHQMTIYMPIWYLQQALRRVGIQYQWHGTNWSMSAVPSQVYVAISPKGAALGTYHTLAAAKAAVLHTPGGIVKDNTGKVVYTQPQIATYAVVAPDGTSIQTAASLGAAEAALSSVPGGMVEDMGGKVLYIAAVPYASYTSAGALLGMFSTYNTAQASLANYPGGTVSNQSGSVLYTQPTAAAPAYTVKSASGQVVSQFPLLTDAESALAAQPGGSVENNLGRVVYTEPTAVLYGAATATGVSLGSFSSLTDATAALASHAGGQVTDTAGNVLYVQPYPYSAYSASGALIGGFTSLSNAERALSQSPGGSVKDATGAVSYRQPRLPGPAAQGDFSTVDLRYAAPNDLTAAGIDAYLLAHKSPLVGLGGVFVGAQADYGVDANYLVSHAILESAWGKSQIALAKNNLYGYGAYDSNPGTDAGMYPSDAYAIRFQAWEVMRSYLAPGAPFFVAPTLRGMNVHYATDKHWAASIASLMNQLAGSVGETAANYPQYQPNTPGPAPSPLSEPYYALNGAQAVVRANPYYSGIPAYSDAALGAEQMYTRVLQNGDYGSDVATLQAALNQKHHSGLTVDGAFGPNTAAALASYQSSIRLTPTGTCNFALWQRLVPAPTKVIPAKSQVTVDEIKQGMVGGLVVEWYHIPQAGWVNSQFIQFTNIYRIAVANPASPTDTSVPVYDSTGSNNVIATLHAGDFVVAKSSVATAGCIGIQFVDQSMLQPLTGVIRIQQAKLTSVK